MESEENQFTVHPVGEDKPKKRRVVRKKKPVTSEEFVEEKKMAKISQELKNIYSDNNGRIPNMRQIQKRSKHPLLRAFFALLIIGGLMAGAAWVGFFYLPGQKQTDSQNITLEINGPTDLSVGATTTYVIHFQNKEKVKINDAVLTVNYPEGFVFVESSKQPDNEGKTEWKIGSINPGESDEVKITGQNFGTIGQQNSWRVFLNYTPENFASELQKMVTLTTKIAEAPVTITALGPDKAAIGDEVEYTYTVKRIGEWPANKLLVKPILPANFYLVTSSPLIAKDNTWSIIIDPATTTPDEMHYKIVGKYNEQGINLEENAIVETGAEVLLPFGADQQMYTIGSSKINTELAKNSQTFSLAINGTMTDFGSRPGEMLNITLYLKNSGKDSMKNVNVKLAVEAPALKKQSAVNWAEISDKLDGTIVGEQINETNRRATITWDSGDLSALAELKPNADATIDLRVPIRSTENFDLAAIGDYLIKTIAEVTYKDKSGAEKTLGSNPVNVTLNSDLTLDIRTEGSGTTRSITWVLGNSFHPLKNLELTATLFGDVTFALGAETPAGTVNYDEKEKKITWQIPEMPESVDVLALPFTVTINKENPTQNTLVSKVRVKAEDTVTAQTIEFMGDEVPLKNE